ncbi:hypothetical protein Tco_0089176 [Tanacetum coccineum]
MYCSIVSAIVSATSSSEYSSWSENRSKSGDLDSSRLSVLKCFLDDRNSHSGSLKGWDPGEENNRYTEKMRKTRSVTISDNQYAVFNGTEYAVLIFLNEYAVLDRKLDTPYPMEVDTPYRVIDQNSLEYGRYGVLTELEYGVLVFPGYGVLTLFPSWSFVKFRHIYAVSSMMYMAYWMSE